MYQCRSMRSVIVVSGLLLLVGCPAQTVKIPEVVDAAVAELDAGPIDAGPPVPASLEPTVTAGLPDGGVVAVTAKAELDAPTSLTITLPIKLKDFRIRLLDWRDQLVVSDDELMADGLTYLISLPTPLKTGRPYSLVLDAELGPIVTSEIGGTFNDWELEFRVAGEIVPDPQSKNAPKKKLKKR